MKQLIFNNSIGEVSYRLDFLDSPQPLDVILDMIKEAKINIRDIFISDITEQYLRYVEELQQTDYEYLSEFLVFAATLLEAKSASMLPCVDIFDEQEDELSAQEKLIIRLENYKLFKDTAEKLSQLEILWRFYREPQFSEDDYRYIVTDFNLDKLVNAFKSILEKIEYRSEEKAVPKTIEKETFTIAEGAKRIIELIRSEKRLSFYTLFGAFFSKNEIVTMFLAVLEVVKRRIITIEQQQDGDILLFHNPSVDKYNVTNIEELLADVEK
jgi:segregation and condensation protein A